MNTRELSKKAYENSVSHGFYECKDCKGKGVISIGNSSEPDLITCLTCRETGKHQDIGEQIMLIITEISEAVEADRKDKRANMIEYKSDYEFWRGVTIIGNSTPEESAKKTAFRNNIKDTFEDEIADVFIRIFDLCGYIGITPIIYDRSEDHCYPLKENESIPCQLLGIVFSLKGILQSKIKESKYFMRDSIEQVICYLLLFCKWHKIDIEKHIDIKMEYNKSRPYKHGKKY